MQLSNQYRDPILFRSLRFNFYYFTCIVLVQVHLLILQLPLQILRLQLAILHPLVSAVLSSI